MSMQPHSAVSQGPFKLFWSLYPFLSHPADYSHCSSTLPCLGILTQEQVELWYLPAPSLLWQQLQVKQPRITHHSSF